MRAKDTQVVIRFNWSNSAQTQIDLFYFWSIIHFFTNSAPTQIYLLLIYLNIELLLTFAAEQDPSWCIWCICQTSVSCVFGVSGAHGVPGVYGVSASAPCNNCFPSNLLCIKLFSSNISVVCLLHQILHFNLNMWQNKQKIEASCQKFGKWVSWCTQIQIQIDELVYTNINTNGWAGEQTWT